MTEQLTRITDEQCQHPLAAYNDLSALFLNCSILLTDTDALLRRRDVGIAPWQVIPGAAFAGVDILEAAMWSNAPPSDWPCLFV